MEYACFEDFVPGELVAAHAGFGENSDCVAVTVAGGRESARGLQFDVVQPHGLDKIERSESGKVFDAQKLNIDCISCMSVSEQSMRTRRKLIQWSDTPRWGPRRHRRHPWACAYCINVGWIV